MKKLTQSQVERFNRDGYLLIEKFFDESTVQRSIEAIKNILSIDEVSKVAEMEPANPQTIRRIWSPVDRDPIFYEMATDPGLLDMIEQLIGKNIALHYNKLNYKGPKVGSLVDWHQDFAFYPHTNKNLLACLIYLDKATEENGCLEVVPQTEYSGLLNHYVDGHFRGKIDSSFFSDKMRVTLPAPAGSVILLHCMTAHFSPVNTSNRERKTFIPAYRATDAFPIYFGPHAAHNEAKAKVIRGERSQVAEVEAMNVFLPIAEKPFGSLYEVQDGSHLKNQSGVTKTGYYIDK